MDEPESVAEWGERWLRDWCNEPGLKQNERETRAWLAEGWRTWTLETVMSRDGWFHELRDRVEQARLYRMAANEVAVYKGTLHALPVWRLFYIYRREGEPVPEFVLAMFEEWAGRLMRLQHAVTAGKRTGDEGAAILRALQFVGERKSHVSMKRLSDLEKRRRIASEISTLRRLYRMPFKTIAQKLRLNEQAAKDLLYEFEPGQRRRRGAASGGGDLVAAHRRMVRK